MGSFSGLLQRPLAAVVAVVAAAVSVDVPDKLHTKSASVLPYTVNSSPQIQSECTTSSSWFSYVSVANPMNLSTTKRLSILSKASTTDGKLLCHQFVAMPLLHGSISPKTSILAHNTTNILIHSHLLNSVFRPSNSLFLQAPLHWHSNKHSPLPSAPVPIFFMLYNSANLTYGLPHIFSRNSSFSSVPNPFKHSDFSTTHSRDFYTWHLPKQEAYGFLDSSKGQADKKKPAVAVVLLGWLGAKQKHLKRYADWYNSRGIHAITFTVPMKDIVSYKPGGKADQNLDLLVTQLTYWMGEGGDGSSEKYLLFHTFSNTGWLTYGVLLEKFLAQDLSLVDNIKGCVVDSAPVATPDPQAVLHSTSLTGKEGLDTHSKISKPFHIPKNQWKLLERGWKLFEKLPADPEVFGSFHKLPKHLPRFS